MLMVVSLMPTWRCLSEFEKDRLKDIRDRYARDDLIHPFDLIDKWDFHFQFGFGKSDIEANLHIELSTLRRILERSGYGWPIADRGFLPGGFSQNSLSTRIRFMKEGSSQNWRTSRGRRGGAPPA
jgi:hypothetical protein